MQIEQATHLINMRSKTLFIEGSNAFEDKLEAYRNIRLHIVSFLKSGALEALINLGAVVAKAIKDCYTDEQLAVMEEFLNNNAYKTETSEDDESSGEPASGGAEYSPDINTTTNLDTILDGILSEDKGVEPISESEKSE